MDACSLTLFELLKRRRIILFVLSLILGLVIWFSPWVLLRYTAALVLLWVLPGLAWASLIPPRALGSAEWLIVGLGLSFVVTPIAISLFSYLPGPLTQVQLLAAMTGVIALPLLLFTLVSLVRPVDKGTLTTPEAKDQHPPSGNRRGFLQGPWIWLLIVVLIAVGLRIANLNYSEFQGDEAIVMVSAARALEGDDTILFEHKKGPSEIALVMGIWRLTGRTNEWMVRLPFAWVNFMGLLAVLFFCRRTGPTYLGAIAVGLLAIEGYLVAFGRIVQYQSLVFGLSTLGLLCLLVYYQKGHRSLIVVGAAFFAGGFLAHYDAMLALPAGMVLVGARLWEDRRNLGRALAPVLVAGFVGLALIGLFYLPFFQGQYSDQTSSYISWRLGAGFANNLRESFVLSAVYDSIYYLVLMLLALGVVLLATWAKWGRTGRWLGGALLLVAATTVLWPERWLVGEVVLAWIPFAILFFGAVLAPGQPMPRRAVWVWFGVPWFFYLFFAAVPLTHVHVFFPPWAILTGLGLIDVARWLASWSRAMRWIVASLAVVLYALCGYYAVMVFVDHTPEYRRTFPEFRQAVYWTPYEQMPQDGLFGFPYRAGWKVVGYLRDTGRLDGNFGSNEEPPITDYYARHAVRWECPTPDVYITAVNVQDEVYIRWDQVQSDYQPAIEVTVGGQPKLVIHRHDITSSSDTYRVEDYARLFDQGTTPDRVAKPAPETKLPMPGNLVEQTSTVGDFARLTGYRLSTEHAVPGGYVDLTLLWEVLTFAPTDYAVFTHLHDGVAMLGQLDGQPVCGIRPTTTWQPAEIVVDVYRIPIKRDAPTGPVSLYVGMYDGRTGDRLPVSNSDGLLLGDNVHLTDVVIRESR